jgi:hypothetical protein
MSLFDRDEFTWRETYFLLFDATKRPTFEQVEQALHDLNPSFEIIDRRADEQGMFESATVLAPEDYSALDISFLEGDEVRLHGNDLAEELRPTVEESQDREKLKRLPEMTARFDIMHFEQAAPTTASEEEPPDEMFDPTALLMVLETLSQLTDGIAIDPQSGTFPS